MEGTIDVSIMDLEPQPDLPVEDLKHPWIDPRPVALSALLVSDRMAQPDVVNRIRALADAGECDPRCATALRTAARAVLAVHSKVAGPLTQHADQISASLRSDSRALRRAMVELAEQSFHGSDDARLWLEVIRLGAKDDVEVIYDLRSLARLYREYSGVLSASLGEDCAADEETARRCADVLEHTLMGGEESAIEEWRASRARTWSLLVALYDEVCRVGYFILRSERTVTRLPSLVTIARVRRGNRPADGRSTTWRPGRSMGPGAMRSIAPLQAVEWPTIDDAEMLEHTASPLPEVQERATDPFAEPRDPSLPVAAAVPELAGNKIRTALKKMRDNRQADPVPIPLPPPMAGLPEKGIELEPDPDSIFGARLATVKTYSEDMVQLELPLPAIDPNAKRRSMRAGAFVIAADPSAPDSSRSSQRSLHRHNVEFEVSIHSESNFYMGFTENFSGGGLFVATHTLKPIGSQVHVSVVLPDQEEPLKLQGVVRWIREYSPNSEAWPGMGIRFEHLSPEDEAQIAAFLKTREPIFFDE